MLRKHAVALREFEGGLNYVESVYLICVFLEALERRSQLGLKNKGKLRRSPERLLPECCFAGEMQNVPLFV